MKTENTLLIKKLAKLGVLPTEPVKNNALSFLNKNDNYITIENDDGVECKILTDNVSDEDLPAMIAAEQLKTVKSIKTMVKFFFISALVVEAIWLLNFLISLGEVL